jgi:hypothetical protein
MSNKYERCSLSNRLLNVISAIPEEFHYIIPHLQSIKNIHAFRGPKTALSSWKESAEYGTKILINLLPCFAESLFFL